MTDLVPVTRTVVESREVLEELLRRRHAAGRLVTPPDQIRAAPTVRDPGKWWVRATFLEPAPKLTWRRRLATLDQRHPIGGPILKALAFGLAVAAGLLGLAAGLLSVLAHTIGLSVLWGAAGFALLSLIVIKVTGTGRGHGRHDGKGWHYTDCK